MPAQEISHEQIRDALTRSGYLLEYNVEKLVGRYGYMAEANQVYPDPITGKSRELDVSAIRCERITSDYRNSFWPRLLIECVNNPQPFGFFTKGADAPTAHVYELKFSGVPVKIREGRYWNHIGDFLNMQRYHHHCKGRIATQFCSFTAKKNSNPVEWFAQHEEAHFDSFNKLCFALNHEIDEHYSHTRLSGKEPINLQMYYPILVVSGELIDIVPTKKDLKLHSVQHIHYVQSHITDGKQLNYHIDVVTQKRLPSLLKTIGSEVTRTVRLIRRQMKAIERSVDLITTSVKGLRSQAAIRERLESRR